MQRLISLCVGLACAALICAGAAMADSMAQAPAQPRRLNTTLATWTGDFGAMRERHLVRIVAPYSRSLYYVDHGAERGIAAGLLRDFERFLNAKYKAQLGGRPITVAVAAVTREQLLSIVTRGEADIAVGNLTITPDRLKLVDMQVTDEDAVVREILVTGPKSPQIGRIDDLAGKTVHVRRASSYYDSLGALSARFQREHKPQIKIVIVPDALEDEDLMEMLNAGLVQAVVVDDWKAKLWTPVLQKLVAHPDIVLRDHGHVGWAFRKNSPMLRAEVADFFDHWIKTHGTLQYRLSKSIRQMKQIGDPTASAEWKRFQGTVKLFDKYGAEFNFDPLMLTAQGYQESQLDQKRHSTVGAVGVMQLMPATGSQMKVGDIKQIDANIHAGAKYMDMLMTRYFGDAAFNDENRTLFAFAAYNCGPGNVAKARKIATERGLDPNKWFNNVEIIIAEKIGLETTTYVRNIYKYYVAYKLIADARARAAAARVRFPAQQN